MHTAIIDQDHSQIGAWDVARLKKSNPPRFKSIKKHFVCRLCNHRVFFRRRTKHGHSDCFVHQKGNYDCSIKHKWSFSSKRRIKATKQAVKKLFRNYEQLIINFEDYDDEYIDIKAEDIALLNMASHNSKTISYELEPPIIKSTVRSLKTMLRYLTECSMSKYKKKKIKVKDSIYHLGDLFIKFDEINNIQHKNEKKIYWGKITTGKQGKFIDNYFLNSTDSSAPKSVSINFKGDAARIFKEKFISDKNAFEEKNALNGQHFEINKQYFLYVAIFGKLLINEDDGKQLIVISDTNDLRYIAYRFVKKMTLSGFY